MSGNFGKKLGKAVGVIGGAAVTLGKSFLNSCEEQSDYYVCPNCGNDIRAFVRGSYHAGGTSDTGRRKCYHCNNYFYVR